jgi:hypothetical protein
MKKVLIAFVLILGMAGMAHADWSVTITWTRSAGPGLASEQMRLDGTTKCTVIPPAATTCQFVVTTLTGQHAVIRSLNSQGAYSETIPLALNADPTPVAATGVMATITYIQP